MTIKNEREYKENEARIERLIQRGTELGDMELLSDEEKEEFTMLSEALDAYVEAQPSIRELDNYLGSDLWKKDLAADEQGLLPHDLKRGVLSEDAIWNLLDDYRALNFRLRNRVTEILGEP